MFSVVGHERQKGYFERTVKSGAFSHAYLLTGPDMVGKRTMAMDVIRALHPGTEPGVSDAYALLLAPGERTTIPLDDIQALKTRLSLRPPPGVRVVVLIDDADRMGWEGPHALLKILEEPPAYVTFFLVTSRPGLLPATVMSRCHVMNFQPVPDVHVAAFLASRKVPAVDRDELAAVAAGRVGWLVRVLDAGQSADVIRSAQELDRRLKEGIAERLSWAKKMADREDGAEVVLRWLAYGRGRLAAEPGRAPVLRGLMELYDALGQPSLNGRLAWEHFLLSV